MLQAWQGKAEKKKSKDVMRCVRGQQMILNGAVGCFLFQQLPALSVFVQSGDRF